MMDTSPTKKEQFYENLRQIYLDEIDRLNDSIASLMQQIRELQASQDALLTSAHNKHLQIVALSEHSDPYHYCAACGWSGPRSQLIWSVPRGFICPECKGDKVHHSSSAATAPDPRSFDTEKAYLESLDKYNDFMAQAAAEDDGEVDRDRFNGTIEDDNTFNAQGGVL